jgi:hypothetical protein
MDHQRDGSHLMGAAQQALLGYGAAAAAAAVTWNPADKNASVTLSNGNKTANAASASQTVRATSSKSTGAWYFEVVFTGNSFSFTVAGIANASALLTQYVGANANGYSHGTGGFSYFNGSGTASAPTLFPGDTLMVAVDLTNLKIWFGVNGTWTGNPAAGTGQQYTIASGTYYPACSPRQTDLILATPTTTYSPPTGFAAWT